MGIPSLRDVLNRSGFLQVVMGAFAAPLQETTEENAYLQRPYVVWPSRHPSPASDLHYSPARACRPRDFGLLLYARLQAAPVVLEVQISELEHRRFCQTFTKRERPM